MIVLYVQSISDVSCDAVESAEHETDGESDADMESGTSIDSAPTGPFPHQRTMSSSVAFSNTRTPLPVCTRRRHHPSAVIASSTSANLSHSFNSSLVHPVPIRRPRLSLVVSSAPTTPVGESAALLLHGPATPSNSSSAGTALEFVSPDKKAHSSHLCDNLLSSSRSSSPFPEMPVGVIAGSTTPPAANALQTQMEMLESFRNRTRSYSGSCLSPSSLLGPPNCAHVSPQSNLLLSPLQIDSSACSKASKKVFSLY